MAVTRRTQKDVDKFKAKFLGPFSIKETFFVGIGIGLSVAAYFIMKNYLHMTKLDDMIPVIAIIMAIAGFFAFAHPHGMSATDFIKNYYENNMLSTKRRPYSAFDGIDYIEMKASQPQPAEAKGGKGGKKKAAPKQPAKPVYKYKPDKHNPRLQ